MKDPLRTGIYFHWPFCKAKCPYCDFNVHIPSGEVDNAPWVEAYLLSLDYYAEKFPDRRIVSVFFGGGTPSLMAPGSVAKILERVQKNWSVANDFEVTLEANPTSVEIEKFKGFRAAGVNRISMGVQSFDDAALKFLGRKHSTQEARQAIEIAQETFERYSFDLIYARPEQTVKEWEDELITALAYARGHLSLYQLTIERNTPFYMRHSRGEFRVPDDVAGADFYIKTQDIMEAHGLPAYEVSNHAADGQACLHNLLYWEYADYIGIGPGAHGRLMTSSGKVATRDHSSPEIWRERVLKHGHGTHGFDAISPQDCFAEVLMMGLRLTGGMRLDQIQVLSGQALEQGIDRVRFDVALAQGWIELTTEQIRLSREGMLRFNTLLPYILQ